METETRWFRTETPRHVNLKAPIGIVDKLQDAKTDRL